MKISGIRTEMPRLSGQESNCSRNQNQVLSMCNLRTGIRIEFQACAVSEPESESSSKPVQSRNRTGNRVLAMDSIGTGIGTELLDWTVSEPESESKKLEPGTSGLSITFRNFTNCDY